MFTHMSNQERQTVPGPCTYPKSRIMLGMFSLHKTVLAMVSASVFLVVIFSAL
jgi:hypothetical protein